MADLSASSAGWRRLPKTSSVSLTEAATATHEFRVTSYSLLDGVGVGQHVSSSIFSAGGCHWIIRFYPDGCKENGSAAWSSVFLHLLWGATDVRVMYGLGILQKDGTEVWPVTQTATEIFEAPSDSRGYPDFVAKSWLKHSSCLDGDCLTIRCVLTVIKGSHHLEDMLKNGEGTDVAFSVDGQVFRAHRCLLAARSPVFKAELFGPTITNECAIRRIQIDDMEPSVFEALLHFIYTDSLPDNHKDGEDAATTRRLLVAAHRYRVDMLKFICETKLTETVDVSSVATMLILAEQHGCPQLRRVCIAFLASPEMLGAVMKTVGFKRLVATCPSVMEQILEKVSCVWGGEDHTSISSWSETVPK
ncbi:hypothetical protein BRADI_5g22405v3 [Brachypodium distachyon]|uniref:BTB domain-containing protein n=1 Tax=Brachypodium distachyon TaxID=15368 RepID=A0A0Q3P6W5_BRADI|nr:hypothetical protein BRADI_5g22405v3 [Brachypodium distachyon]